MLGIEEKLPKDCSQKDFIDIINKINPCIPIEKINKFKKEEEILKKRNK